MKLHLYYGNNRQILEDRILDIGDKKISPKMLFRKINETLCGVFNIEHAKWVIAKKQEDRPEWCEFKEKHGSNFWGIKIF